MQHCRRQGLYQAPTGAKSTSSRVVSYFFLRSSTQRYLLPTLSKSIACRIDAGQENLQSPPSAVDATSPIYGAEVEATAKVARVPGVIIRGVEFRLPHPSIQVARGSHCLKLMQIDMRSTLNFVEAWEAIGQEGAARRHWKRTHSSQTCDSKPKYG
jgi:hypothetical protein